MRRARLASAALAWAACVLGPGCDDGGCLTSEDAATCASVAPCAGLSFACDGGFSAGFVVAEEHLADLPAGARALGSVGDWWLRNDQIEVVIDAIDHPHYVAPTGGSILDLAPAAGGADPLNNAFQSVGLLPWDAVAYTDGALREAPGVVTLQLVGHLDGRPEIRVATRYELRACEPGLRVRTEVYNGEPDPQVWTVTDGFYWGSKSNLPFAPRPGGGWAYPRFGLREIDSVFREAPFVAATLSAEEGGVVGSVACDRRGVHGFDTEFVSAVGAPRRIVEPGDYEVFERLILVAGGRSVAAVADTALEVRRQLLGEPWVEVHGVLAVAPGIFGGAFGPEARASVLLSRGRASDDPAARVPWSHVVPEASGRWSARLPAHQGYVLEVEAFGRTVRQLEVAVAGDEVDLGVVQVPSVAEVTLEVRTDGVSSPAMVYFHPTGPGTHEAVAGRYHGRFVECAPLLGPPHGPSPACNRALVVGPTPVVVPPGSYDVYAWAGPFATIDRATIDLQGGERLEVPLELVSLPVVPGGWLSGDFHVHGAASYDSALPERDRVLSFLAAGVDVVVATDHDVAHDYTAAIAAAGYGDRLVALPGVEATGHIVYRWVPGTSTPKVVGHWNAWPLPVAAGPWRGAPWDELAEPGLLLTRLQDAGWDADTGVAQMNHPMSSGDLGRDLGFPVALGLQGDEPLSDDPTVPQGVLGRRPEGARWRNDAYHVQEVMNSTDNTAWLRHRALWFYLLEQGMVRGGTANSDSHGLTDNVLGVPRNLVRTATTVSAFDATAFNAAVRAGRIVGTNGPFIEVACRDAAGEVRRPSTELFVPDEASPLEVTIRAAPWVPVDEVRVVVNGAVVRRISDGVVHLPPDPFGDAGLARYQGTLDLRQLLPAGGDAWLLVEAGHPLPRTADLDCDGFPDTGDNDGDGAVTYRDVDRDDDGDVDAADLPPQPPPACDREVGPLRTLDLPRDRDAPGYAFWAVTPGAQPVAFTNPLILDRDGDGAFVRRPR